MDIGQRIRGLRTAQDVTQTGLAEKIGVPQNYVSQVETSGEKSFGLSIRQVSKFAQGLGVHCTALIDQDEYDRALAALQTVTADV